MTDQTVKVLLVEDNDVDVEAVRRAFQKCRIANPVHVARDGVEALEILRGDGDRPPLKRPYLILLDLNMPRMDGVEFLQELRADEELQDSIVLVLTTSNRDQDKVASYDQHVAGYIVKKDVGRGFLKLLDLLDCYWRIVEFPPARDGGQA